jgi:hypothetical protein
MESLTMLMINRQRLRDDRIVKLDALGASLGFMQVTTDTAFNVMRCIIIDRGSSSLFLPLFQRVLTLLSKSSLA